MEKTVSVAEAKNKFSDLLNRVIYRHERVKITKRGKLVGVIMSAEDSRRLEEFEDRERVKRVRALKKSTKKYIPFEQVVRNYEKKWGVDLGLDFTEGGNVRE
jgi:prevent-host-death family protein